MCYAKHTLSFISTAAEYCFSSERSGAEKLSQVPGKYTDSEEKESYKCNTLLNTMFHEVIANENTLILQIQYRAMKRQRSICVGLIQRIITSGKLTKTYNKPYIFLKIKARTLLFGTVFTKLANITKLK
jgi:hypothetical protein